MNCEISVEHTIWLANTRGRTERITGNGFKSGKQLQNSTESAREEQEEEGGRGGGMADKLLDGAVKDIYERLNLTDFFY